jgi:hypothetical protein
MKKILILLTLGLTTLMMTPITWAWTNLNDADMTNYNYYSSYYGLRYSSNTYALLEMQEVWIYLPYFDGFQYQIGALTSSVNLIDATGNNTQTTYNLNIGGWKKYELNGYDIKTIQINMIHNKGSQGYSTSQIAAVDNAIVILTDDDYEEYVQQMYDENNDPMGLSAINLGIFWKMLDIIPFIFGLSLFGSVTVGALAMIPISWALFNWLLKMMGRKS